MASKAELLVVEEDGSVKKEEITLNFPNRNKNKQYKLRIVTSRNSASHLQPKPDSSQTQLNLDTSQHSADSRGFQYGMSSKVCGVSGVEEVRLLLSPQEIHKLNSCFNLIGFYQTLVSHPSVLLNSFFDGTKYKPKKGKVQEICSLASQFFSSSDKDEIQKFSEKLKHHLNITVANTCCGLNNPTRTMVLGVLLVLLAAKEAMFINRLKNTGDISEKIKISDISNYKEQFEQMVKEFDVQAGLLTVPFQGKNVFVLFRNPSPDDWASGGVSESDSGVQFTFGLCHRLYSMSGTGWEIQFLQSLKESYDISSVFHLPGFAHHLLMDPEWRKKLDSLQIKESQKDVIAEFSKLAERFLCLEYKKYHYTFIKCFEDKMEKCSVVTSFPEGGEGLIIYGMLVALKAALIAKGIKDRAIGILEEDPGTDVPVLEIDAVKSNTTNDQEKSGQRDRTKQETIDQSKVKPTDPAKQNLNNEPKQVSGEPKQEAGDERKQEAGDECKREAGNEPKQEASGEPKQKVGGEPKQEAGGEPEQEAGDERKQEAGDEPKQEAGGEPKQEANDERKQEAGDECKKEAGDERKQEAGDKHKQEAGDEHKQEAGDECKQEAGDEHKREAEAGDLAEKEVGDERKQEAGDEPKQEASGEPKQEASGEPKQEADDERKQEASGEPKQEAGGEPKQEAGDERKQEAGDEPKQEASGEPKQEANDERKQEAGDECKQEAGDKHKQEAGDEHKQEAGDECKQEAGDEHKQEAGDECKQEAGDLAEKEVSDECKQEAGDERKQEADDERKQEVSDEPKQEISDEHKQEVSDEPKQEAGDEPKQEARDEDKQETEDEAKQEASIGHKLEAEDETKQEVGDERKQEANEAGDLAIKETGDLAKKEASDPAEEETIGLDVQRIGYTGVQTEDAATVEEADDIDVHGSINTRVEDSHKAALTFVKEYQHLRERRTIEIKESADSGGKTDRGEVTPVPTGMDARVLLVGIIVIFLLLYIFYR
ncbi:titin homolog [Pelobates fuscus]|uniref:titin homolog n=1 Tax=Pelobates fuscus TaxID=191477 RepID=UPI002FE4F651